MVSSNAPLPRVFRIGSSSVPRVNYSCRSAKVIVAEQVVPTARLLASGTAGRYSGSGAIFQPTLDRRVRGCHPLAQCSQEEACGQKKRGLVAGRRHG